jgi:hypothetical protein
MGGANRPSSRRRHVRTCRDPVVEVALCSGWTKGPGPPHRRAGRTLDIAALHTCQYHLYPCGTTTATPPGWVNPQGNNIDSCHYNGGGTTAYC